MCIRDSITAEDAGRYEALRLWLIESGAVGQNELPVIDGSLTLPEQDGVEVVLEPKASVDNSGNASAAVTAADLNKLLDEALEAEASVLVIAPTGAEQASAISVELPRCTLDNALDETNADLAVRTPLGELSMPNLTLARILSGAGGKDLTVNMARRTISQAEALLNGRADVTEEQMSGASVVEAVSYTHLDVYKRQHLQRQTKISWSRHLLITKPRPTMWSTIAVVKIYRSSQETPFTSVWANTSGRP